MKTFPYKKLLIPILAVVLLLGLAWGIQTARADQSNENSIALQIEGKSLSILRELAAQDEPESPWNPNCVMCHQYTKFYGVTRDSMQVSLSVDEQILSQSVHGGGSLSCTSCHTRFTGYPHGEQEQVTCEQCHVQDMTLMVPLAHESPRAMQIELNESCRNCHSDQYSGRNMHTPVAERGQVNTPICIDCHGGHDVKQPTVPPERVVNVCSRCHVAVADDFQSQQHYYADPERQTCIDCHLAHSVQVVEAVPTPTPEPAPVEISSGTSYLDMWNSTCTMCHAYPNLIGEAQDLSRVSLMVTGQQVNQSVHGKAGLGCAACHQSIVGYPHHETEQVTCSACHGSADPNAEIVASLPYASSRDMSLQLNEACRTCHETQYLASVNSMHNKNLEAGNQNAPLCVDCHGSHDIQPITQIRSQISQFCAGCHASVYTSYQSSVHGVAVEKNNSPDAPTCVECHGAHDVRGPRQVGFRFDSVGTCVDCHQNQEMMSRYDIPADLFNPNVDDYHSDPVSLFRQPGSTDTSKLVVCYDCHGVHTIQGPEDPSSTVNSANLLGTCQQCHPDAGSRFTGVGLAHSRSAGKAPPILTWFNRIYFLLILAMVGFLLFYILLDVLKRRQVKRELIRQALVEK